MEGGTGRGQPDPMRCCGTIVMGTRAAGIVSPQSSVCRRAYSQLTGTAVVYSRRPAAQSLSVVMCERRAMTRLCHHQRRPCRLCL